MLKIRPYFFAVLIFMLAGVLFGNNAITAKASNSSAPAAAIWQMSDGFEGATIWDRWSCWNTIADPDNGCGFFNGGGLRVHGGSNSAILRGLSGWSDIGRNVSLTPWMAGRKLTCVAQIYVYVNDLAFPDGFRGQLEVIDVDTWTYLAIKPYTITNHNWTAITTAGWVPPRKNVFVRIGTIGNDWATQFAYVDDMFVQCSYK
jgi:hypothetical protein